MLAARSHAQLVYGLQYSVDRDTLRESILQGSIGKYLQRIPVKKNDIFFVRPGTIHAICAGTLLAEIQENSNVTYRVYDYGRRDKNGNLRKLHIEKALEVTDLFPVKKIPRPEPHIGNCKYFTVDKVNLSGKISKKLCGTVDETSFLHMLFLSGEGKIKNGNEDVKFKKGDSFFLPAGDGNYEISGECEALFTYI